MRRPFLLSCLLAVLALLPGPSFAGAQEALVVVVPHAHTGKPLDLAELAMIYRRKELVWSDGTRIQPTNLPPDSPERRTFSQRVLGSLPEALVQYWNAMYYHGISPPHVFASEEAVLRFVAETPGAIGYLSACKLDTRVKPILWIGPDGAVSGQAPSLDCGHE